MYKKWILIGLIGILFVSACIGQEKATWPQKTSVKTEAVPVEIEEGDKCPVCGMFVHKYPKWTTEIIFKEGSVVKFDGPGDMMMYYHQPEKYYPEGTGKDGIVAIFVKDYYTQEWIDGRDAYYVTGSDVRGPMGEDLVPFKHEQDAKRFVQQYNGEKIVRFHEAALEMLKKLQSGMDMGKMEGMKEE